MNFIHKLFQDLPDDETHRQFKRYGKGDYENKALIDITRSKKDVKIKTSFEFAEEFAKILANDLKGKTRVTGVIITTKDTKLLHAARNIPGTDVVEITQLNTELLAPGAKPGRLTIFTQAAIEHLEKTKLFM